MLQVGATRIEEEEEEDDAESRAILCRHFLNY
jgi:hypothetical protein